jgi:Bacterial Ig-like domain (group 2)
MRRQVVALTLLATLVGCDSRTPTSPDPRDDGPQTPPPPDPAAEVSALSISGDNRFTELNEVHRLSATAQLVNGASRDVTTESTWSSSNPEVATVSGHGEVTSLGVGLATITASYFQVGTLDIVVAPGDPTQITGLYRLSFTAAPSCAALPDWARHREYDATIDQSPSVSPEAGVPLLLSVQLQPGFAPVFRGLIKGSRVGFGLETDDPYSYTGGGDPIFAERIDDGRLFTVNGGLEGTKGASRNVQITGSLRHGPIRAINPATGVTIAECQSSENHFSLVRQ